MGSCTRETRRVAMHWVGALGLALAAIAIPPGADLWAHGAGGHGGSDSRNQPKPAANAESPRRSVPIANLADRPMQPPHGGQITATKHHYFEVVYSPSETRVYVYNASQHGLNARRLRGKAVMTVRSSGQSGSFPLEVVAQPAFTGDLGYLAAKVDISRVKDGDMDVRFDLEKLLPEEPEASFTQTFFLARPPMPVSLANLSAADQQPVAMQGICPVTETRLGDHGNPIKLVVGNQPVYVCCEGCVQSVQNDPHGYLQKTSHIVQVNQTARRPNPPAPQGPQITRAQLTADDRPLVLQARQPGLSPPPTYRGNASSPVAQVVAVVETTPVDDAAIQAQRICPVMKQPLGAHGRPIKLLIDGQPLFVCCNGCINQVQRDPLSYVSHSAYRQPIDRGPQQDAWFYERPAPLGSAAGGSCCSSGNGASCH